MKNINTLFIIIIFPSFMFSQLTKQKDSLVEQMCLELKNDKNLSDSLRINNAYKKHLDPFLAKFEGEEINSIVKSIYFRFQRNCLEFNEIVSRAELNKSDWVRLEKGYKPESKLSKQKCRKLNMFNNLSYLEYNGDEVLLELKDGIWLEIFLDGTYSKLNFSWINDCDFELKFIESNNETRENFSNEGDTYNYRLIEKTDEYYIVIVKVPNENNYLRFKIHTK